jgi:peptidoglycan/xylan/chitin deacetylase (PgdA/CDA1 family)
VKRLEAIIERPLALLLLPLSLVPFFLVVPQMIEARELYDRRHKSGPLAAPEVALTPAQHARFQPVAPYSGAIPVLAYHGIRDQRDGYSVSRHTFAEQMAALKRMGFSTITAEQFARFRRGDARGLPPRPLLITFDDGRLDSYRGADAVLEEHGFRATMFVITSHIERKSPFYLTWKELHRMEDSGRWGIEPHAHEGHSKVVYGSHGNSLPYYAVRRYTRSEGLETFADYERRVSEDLFAVREKMLDQGFEPHAFAVPYGNYGQRETNDPGIAPYMRALMQRQFGVYFVQDEENDPDYAGRTGEAARFEVHSDTTTDRLYMWLRDHSPGRAAQEATRP